MKMNTKITLYTSIGLTLGLLVGCGGGSSSDDGDTPPASTLATLSPETSELMAKSVSESLPGCSFVVDGAAAKPTDTDALDMIKKSVVELGVYAQAGKALLEARPTSAREVNETYQGTCPSFPGSYTLVGTHDDGIDDVVMTFNDFCIGTDTENSVIAGKVDMRNVGIPSDTGPIPQTSELSTPDGGLQVTETSAEGVFTHVAQIDDLKFTYGDGDNDATIDSPDLLVADAIRVVDGRSGGEFSVSNVDVSTYVSDTGEVFKVNSVTYQDPDNGAVTLSTTDLLMDEEGVLQSGTVTATGADNTSMSIVPSASGDNVFNVMVDGESIGEMNCTDMSLDTEFLDN